MKWQSFALAAGIFAELGASTPARSALATFAPLNGRVTPTDLAGHVVVVDIFTVDCSNCQNVVPALRSLYAKDRSRGLRVVGIHAPETPEEPSRHYVEQSLARQGIVWPSGEHTTRTFGRPNSSSTAADGCAKSSSVTHKTTPYALPSSRYSKPPRSLSTWVRATLRQAQGDTACIALRLRRFAARSG